MTTQYKHAVHDCTLYKLIQTCTDTKVRVRVRVCYIYMYMYIIHSSHATPWPISLPKICPLYRKPTITDNFMWIWKSFLTMLIQPGVPRVGIEVEKRDK